MNPQRLTIEDKGKYISPAKKDRLIQRLAAYENTGLEPDEVIKQRDTITKLKQYITNLKGNK